MYVCVHIHTYEFVPFFWVFWNWFVIWLYVETLMTLFPVLKRTLVA